MYMSVRACESEHKNTNNKSIKHQDVVVTCACATFVRPHLPIELFDCLLHSRLVNASAANNMPRTSFVAFFSRPSSSFASSSSSLVLSRSSCRPTTTTRSTRAQATIRRNRPPTTACCCSRRPCCCSTSSHSSPPLRRRLIRFVRQSSLAHDACKIQVAPLAPCRRSTMPQQEQIVGAIHAQRLD